MSDMKCPDCGDIIVHCLGCEGQYQAIDPTELLRLIEAVMKKQMCAMKIEIDTLAATRDYLSGDHEPLKKLAGEE